jgi:sigma-B regulation protein RsbU (phosphoserine phosphatase)
MSKQRRIVQLENELNVARQIQNGLFPADLEPTSEMWVRAFNEPGRQVSGDTYDIVRMGDGRIGLVIADVTGKGIAAALLSANLQAAVRVTLPGATDLADVVSQWNTLLCENTDQTKFVTLLLMVIDPANRNIEYVNAGHPAPWTICPPHDPVEFEGEIGLPLGIVSTEEYRVVHAKLNKEPASILLFTDGIPEAMNEDGELFELGRLRDTLGRVKKIDPESLISDLRSEIKHFCGRADQADDITILVAHLP